MISQQDMDNYKKKMKDRLALLTFVDDLIRQRKDPRINESNLPQIRDLLLKQINEAVNTHLITLLNDQDQAELSVLLDKDASDDDLNAFFKSKVHDFEVEMTVALLNFRAAYLYPVTQKQVDTNVKQTIQSQPEDKKTSFAQATAVKEEKKDPGHLPPAPVM